MGKYTVCVSTYIVVESDDLDSAYADGEALRGGLSHILHEANNNAVDEFKQDIIDVELTGVYEIEETENAERS